MKNLTGKKFAVQFKIVLESLENAGYNNYWKVLNAKDFGIPQNRERVFIFSIRKDVDTGIFEFPKPYPLKLRLKDMLEDVVDEKFYLSDVQIEKLHLKSVDALVYDKSMLGFENNSREYNDIMPTITSREWKEPRVINETKLNEITSNTDKVMQIGNCRPTKNRVNPNQGRIYDVDGISPCLNTKGGGNLEPHIVEPKVIGGIGEKKSNGGQQWYQQDRIYDGEKVAISVTTNFNPYYSTHDLRIRKLTPKECFRLMGFKDEDFEKAEMVNSNTQLYKQVGNSIVVDVAEELLCMLFDEDGNFFV